MKVISSKENIIAERGRINLMENCKNQKVSLHWGSEFSGAKKSGNTVMHSQVTCVVEQAVCCFLD